MPASPAPRRWHHLGESATTRSLSLFRPGPCTHANGRAPPTLRPSAAHVGRERHTAGKLEHTLTDLSFLMHNNSADV
eukprot:scaffold119278_cov33-Tisochrysis_lutea.AAC.1